MYDQKYILLPLSGGATAFAFPEGVLGAGEAPAEAVRRILDSSIGTEVAGGAKLELLDLLPADGDLLLLFRALLTELPSVPHRAANRMELPNKVGRFAGRAVEDAMKTSLAYKLTRSGR